jgi:excisionase family DNA binding protein
MARRLLTAAEAAEVLRITPIQAVKLCRRGELRATKPGKSWLIDAEDLDAYLDAHSNDDLRGPGATVTSLT